MPAVAVLARLAGVLASLAGDSAVALQWGSQCANRNIMPERLYKVYVFLLIPLIRRAQGILPLLASCDMTGTQSAPGVEMALFSSLHVRLEGGLNATIICSRCSSVAVDMGGVEQRGTGLFCRRSRVSIKSH